MKRTFIYAVLMVSVAVFAQQVVMQQDEPGPASEPTGESAAPGEDENVANAENTPLPEGDEENASVAAADESEPGAEAAAEATEVADEVEFEFEPDEEISEDYPIPLPSDI